MIETITATYEYSRLHDLAIRGERPSPIKYVISTSL